MKMHPTWLAMVLCGCTTVTPTPRPPRPVVTTCPETAIVVQHDQSAYWKRQARHWETYAKLLETKLGMEHKNDSGL